MLIRKCKHFLFIVELFPQKTDHVFRGLTYAVFYSEDLLKIYNMKTKINFLHPAIYLKHYFTFRVYLKHRTQVLI